MAIERRDELWLKTENNCKVGIYRWKTRGANIIMVRVPQNRFHFFHSISKANKIRLRLRCGKELFPPHTTVQRDGIEEEEEKDAVKDSKFNGILRSVGV